MLRALPVDQLLLLLMVGVSCIVSIVNTWRSRLADGCLAMIGGGSMKLRY